MANHPSALKRHRQSLERRKRNRALKTRIRTVLKQARSAIESGAAEGPELVRDVTSLLDRAASKNVVPRERASRLKARLSRQVNKAAPQSEP